MKEHIIQEKAEWALEPAPGSPSAVVTLPFDPKMTPKGIIETAIKDALVRAARQLMARYPQNEALPVIDKLQRLAGGLNYSTHKKSIALFVSPGTEKVLYLDEPMESRVLVDSDFRIRDLTLSGESVVQYLVLLLSGRRSKMYQSEGSGLQLIKSNSLRPSYAYYNEVPEKVANFSDPSARKQVLLDKFLHHMDEGLTAILNAYPLPVFVIATDKVSGHFARITRNDRHIAGYIHKNCMRAGEEDLLSLLQPYLRDWRIVRQQMALKQIDNALETGKLAIGIEEVNKAVRSRNNRLLVVERGLSEPGGRPYHQDASREFYIRDRVDAIIGQVLQYGGRVEWVDPGRLEKLGHIALIRYF
jgi:hypothetical protein